MTKNKQARLLMIWNTVRDEPFNRKDLKRLVACYMRDNYDLTYREYQWADYVYYQVDSLVHMGCARRVGPATYQLIEEYFNQNIFQVD